MLKEFHTVVVALLDSKETTVMKLMFAESIMVDVKTVLVAVITMEVPIVQ